MPREYAIIDIETTGRSALGQKVTEIAIIIHDGTQIIEEFQSLVNPETSIPYSITQLTGIYDEMVMNSPKFYEIAKKVYQMTEGRVFVAHNVGFDFGVLKSEFQSLGGTFEREKLCTVKLSRKLLIGHKSYSLGKLCDDLGIVIDGRHRAYGDAAATVTLFEMILKKAKDMGIEDLTEQDLKSLPKIPPILSLNTYRELPKYTGVYYIYNEHAELIYIGKANNIRQRILSHFNDKSRKERMIFNETADIKTHHTGSELIALLHESEEIKKHQPKYNRALKKTKSTHGIYVYENLKGIKQLSVAKIRVGNTALMAFSKLGQAKNFMENLVNTYNLCPKYCGIEKTNGSCFASSIKKCRGVCGDKESVSDYNARVDLAIQAMSLEKRDFFIIEPGRDEQENGIVQIKNGQYMGFGYVTITDFDNDHYGYEKFIIRKENNSDSQKIILGYLKKKAETTV